MAYIGKVTAGGTTYHVGSTLYGTCDTAAATVAKVAIVDGFDTLETGVTVHIKFTNANTATGPTLAIKPSSSGTAVTAKSIKKNGTTAPGTTAATSWMDGSVVSFTYDGTYWQMNDHIDNTDTYVTQTNTTTNADYRVLLSANANDTTQTTTARKSTNFKANPSTGNLTIGGQLTDKWGLQSFRSLTTAQYNALSSTEKNNGTYYHLTDSYSDASFDSNVSQTPTTADHDYRVLLSGSDNDTASVEGALKNTDLIYNPYKHELRLYEDVSATAANYVQIYPNLINIHSNIDQMRVESNDIWYNNSWDGTNNSLKSTISSLKQSLSDLGKRLVNTRLICNSSGYFPLNSGDTPPYNRGQITVITRNRNTGAIYALWYDNSVTGFRVGAVISGSNPSQGNTVDIQYQG